MSLQVTDFHASFSGLSIEASFRVLPGERLVLSGPSGSGKTSLLRFIAGFSGNNSAAGKVFLAGQEISLRVPERRELGVIFQEPQVFPSLSVLENAAFGLRVRGVGRRERRDRVLPWLERVGLGPLADQSPLTLSGGEKQRLALVRALAWGPQALLLDEPFSALDPISRREMGQWLIEIHRENPIPLLLVTHDQDEATRVGTRILAPEIKPGKFRWLGS
ncbi:MAG: ATP-binding cassette domain-containing protein [Bdellovibrionales bacterium]|nr:ATP-binding cassette domain-containing protein [Bdellovibrionales bacterium]